MLLSEYLEIFPHSYHVRAKAGKEKLQDRDRPQETCNRQTASKSSVHMLIRNLERCRRVVEGQGLPWDRRWNGVKKSGDKEKRRRREQIEDYKWKKTGGFPMKALFAWAGTSLCSGSGPVGERWCSILVTKAFCLSEKQCGSLWKCVGVRHIMYAHTHILNTGLKTKTKQPRWKGLNIKNHHNMFFSCMTFLHVVLQVKNMLLEPLSYCITAPALDRLTMYLAAYLILWCLYLNNSLWTDSERSKQTASGCSSYF